MPASGEPGGEEGGGEGEGATLSSPARWVRKASTLRSP